MPSSIKTEDKPVSVIVDQSTPQTSYVVQDIKGVERARFYDQGDANEFAEAANAPEKLMQDGMHDTGGTRSPERRAKPKGRKMPRGIPKKKRAKKSVKKAAVVKKAAKKTMKRRKRRA